MIRKIDVTDWKNSPVTIKLFELLDEAKKEYYRRLLRQFDTVDKVSVNAARQQGCIEVINLVLDAELHDEEEIDGDKTDISTSATRD